MDSRTRGVCTRIIGRSDLILDDPLSAMVLTRQKVSAFLRVIRFDKPIGTYLLLAPALWASGLPIVHLCSRGLCHALGWVHHK